MEIINKYEEYIKKLQQDETLPTATRPTTSRNFNSGVAPGLRPERIVGASEFTGRLMFLMKWAGEERASFVTNEWAKENCPQLLIRFYEERLIWGNRNVMLSNNCPGNEE